MQKLSFRHILLAILACFLWSTAFVGVKTGLRYAQPLYFAGTRFMLSGLILLPFVGGLRHYFALVRRYHRRILAIGLVQTFIAYAFFYQGIDRVPGALAAIVIGSAPLITALVAHISLHDDRMTLAKTVSMSVGITGVALIGISRRPWITRGLPEFFGVLILLAGSISGAFGNVLVARNGKRVPPLVLNSAQLFIGGFLLLILSLLVEGSPLGEYPPLYYLSLGYLSILSAAAFSIWFFLLQRPGVKVSSLNLWKFIIPVFGAILSWLLLPDEYPEVITVVGMLLVATSIVAFNLCIIMKRCD